MARGVKGTGMTPDERRAKDAERKRKWRAKNLESERAKVNKYKAEVRAGIRVPKKRATTEVEPPKSSTKKVIRHATREDALEAIRASKRKYYNKIKNDAKLKEYNKNYCKQYKLEVKTGERKVKHKPTSSVVKEKKKKANRDWFRKKYAAKKSTQDKKTIDDYNKKYG